MRKIKFRGWRARSKTMHRDGFIIYPESGRCEFPDGGWDLQGYIEDDSFILMQFTGLLDKNGVEIYEGDIVSDDLIGIGQIKWNEQHSAFKILHKNGHTAKWFVDYLPNEFKYLRVIGNIYENPELLEGSTNVL